MNTWPDTSRPPPFVYKNRLAIPSESSLPGVRIQYGAPGSLRLDVRRSGNKNKALKLKVLAAHSTDSKLEELVPPTLVYPPTNTQPSLPSLPSSVTLLKRTEATKRFLDNHRDPLHIPYSLVHQHLADLQTEEEDPTFLWDPYQANTLACSWAKPLRWRKQVGFVLAPTGPVGQELNVSPIYWNPNEKEDIYLPCSFPTASFSTPILQIVASPYHYMSTALTSTSPTIAVRIHASTYLITLFVDEEHGPEDPGLAVRTKLLLEITTEMTARRRHMDVALSPWESDKALVVDSMGGVWEWTGGKAIVMRREPLEDVKPNSFFRITYGSDPNLAYLMSDQQIRVLDLSHPSKDTTLFDLTGSSSYLTSFQHRSSKAQFESDVICFSTTESVSWVDRNVPGRTLVAWEHYRGFDRTLQVWEVASGLVPTTLLTSRLANLITAYTVSSTFTPCESLTDPYLLSNPRTAERRPPRQGLAFFHHPYLPQERAGEQTMFELGSDQAVWMRKLGGKDDLERTEKRPKGFKWLPCFQKWTEEKTGEKKRLGWLEEREKKVVDLREVFERLFTVPSFDPSSSAKEAVEQIARMERFLGELTAPLGGMMTSRDIASACLRLKPALSSSNPSSRTIYPSPGNLDFVSQQLSCSKLGEPAAFQSSPLVRINRLIGRASEEAPVSVQNASQLASQFREDYDIEPFSPPSTGDGNERDPVEDSTTTQSNELKTFASYACDLLAFDLALASTVYSFDRFVPAGNIDPDDELERATQAMSLAPGQEEKDEESPPIHFSFFRPEIAASLSESEGRKLGVQNGQITGSKTARMLMSQWLIGEDPQDYQHVDLKRGSPSSEVTADGPRKRLPTSSAAAIAARLNNPSTLSQPAYPSGSIPALSTFASQPPSVFTRMAPPLRSTDGPTSQPAFFSHSVRPAESQPFFQSSLPQSSFEAGPNTQIVRGPFGGRPPPGGAGGTKTKKKRMGGF